MDNMENINENLDQTPEMTADKKKTEEGKVNDSQNLILSYLHDLVFLLAGLLILFVLLFRIVVVSGDSMLNTLHEGDYLIVLSSSVYRDPKPGDVVVISKDAYKEGEPLVKRVIAVSGQELDIKQGVVYVDGVAQEGEFTHEGYLGESAQSYPITIPEGYVFVLGDNRDNSTDSRSSKIGLIDEREVLGKVLIIALPAEDENTRKRDFSRFGAV